LKTSSGHRVGIRIPCKAPVPAKGGQ
jgi:hypothetical protein